MAASDVSAPVKPAVENGAFSSPNNPIEKLCVIGDPMIIEWKGVRHHALMRGAKLEIIATNLTGQKPRLAILPETSFLLTDMPKDYANAGFEFNSPLTMRFLRDGKVYAFKTMLLRVHSHPPLMVLEYPEKVEYHNMRSNERVGLILPVRITENGGAVCKMGTVLDISPAGIRIGLDAVEGIKVGGKLGLSFTLPNGVVVNHLTAAIRSLSEEHGKYLLGTSLLDYAPSMAGFCRQCEDFAAGIQTGRGEAMLELGKEAVIEFAKKHGWIMVRGWKPGVNGYILSEKPRGPLPPLSLGQEAVVRLENAGVVYGMAVTYKEALKKTNLCVFALHDDVMARKLREEERVQCFLPVSVRRAENRSGALDSGMIIDLCKGGLRFVTRAPMLVETGEMLSASFYPGGMGFMDGQKIRMMRVDGHGSWFEYAAQFVDMNQKDAKLLNDYIALYRAWAI